jgi:extracellular elastinolytic metalloproteinase
MQAVQSLGGRGGPRGRWALPLIVAGAAALAAAPASAVVQHDGLKDQRYADLDARKASVAPTGAQQDIVKALDARARWNEFGTPRSLIRDGGFLATGIKAGDAEAAARA